MIKLDARNLSCPEPLLMLKNAIKKNKAGEDICLLLSSQNALENCKRFAQKAGYTVSVAEAEYGYQLVMKV